MIQVEHLTKRYGENLAIDDVTFSVNKGEVLGFLGPNGAGKTTTMKILTGFMPPTNGTAKLAGYDVFSQTRRIQERLGYMPEQPPVYQDMTIGSYLHFCGELKGVKGRELTRALDRVVEQCGLGHVRKRLIGHVSKGYRQRTGLAQALIHNPEILILDEPTQGLDPMQIIEIRNTIRGLAGDHTVVISSHILPEVQQTCQRVVVINRGRVVATDTLENLSHALRDTDQVTVRLISAGDGVEETLGGLEGVHKAIAGKGEGVYLLEIEPSDEVRERVAHTCLEKRWGLVELHTQEASLEEVFLNLTLEENHAEDKGSLS